MEKFNNYSTLFNSYPELATRLKNNVGVARNCSDIYSK